MAGVYIHIPFCKQACYYCDFHFSTNQGRRGEMVQAIRTELSLQKGYLEGEAIQTIYLGGGTPSLLSENELNSILQDIHKNFTLGHALEITLEANPDDLSKEKLKALREAGINRLSIGIQSFDDNMLKSLNRAHNAWMAQNCVSDAYAAGFTNLSLDLIYAIPKQDDNLWKKNIEQVLALRPQHISSYALTIEEKTIFGRWAAQGKIRAVDDDFAAMQLQLLVDCLEKEQYEQYEVSNFSQPGFQSQHNSNYWKGKKYLGVGPSAHSYNGESRQFNVSNNSAYLNAIADDKIPATVEILTREDKINEYLLTTLRTSWGANLVKLHDELGFDLVEVHGAYIRRLEENKLAIVENQTLILTKKGKLLADKIASDLFVLSSYSA